MHWIANPETREFESHPVLQEQLMHDGIKSKRESDYFKVG